jgi:hypothetical protein
MANPQSRGSYASERRADRRGWYPAAKLDLAVLYCAVGKREYELIETSGFRRFPRLPKQPYFYPVTSEESATLIARDWNMKDAASGRTGYVLRFRIRSEFLGKYHARTFGSTTHRAYWIPAADLEEFNDAIDGVLEPIAFFRG